MPQFWQQSGAPFSSEFDSKQQRKLSGLPILQEEIRAKSRETAADRKSRMPRQKSTTENLQRNNTDGATGVEPLFPQPHTKLPFLAGFA
jgi:hypothetical protein